MRKSLNGSSSNYYEFADHISILHAILINENFVVLILRKTNSTFMEVLLGNNDNLFLCLKGFPFTVYTGDV